MRDPGSSGSDFKGCPAPWGGEDVTFAWAEGWQLRAESGELKYRARQNVVFEHGFLIGKIGRENVTPLVEGAIELPNDISGIVYINDKDWQLDIAKEMKAAGYDIDFNKLI